MVKYLLIGISAILLFACNPLTDEAPRPNIVLIMTDDQGWGDLSRNGNQNIQTPHIDGLAENGVVLDRFFVSPVCSPTRAELLTGRYAVRGGVYSTSEGGERLDLDEVTIAQYLKEVGYATACYGKWHNGMQYPYHPNARGFDDFYGFCSGHWGNYVDPMLEHNGAIVKGEGFLIDDFTNRGIDFIQKNKHTPFFLYLPYNTPHSPMQVPEQWWNEVKDIALPSLGKEQSEADSNFTRAALAFTKNIDWNVGRILEALKDQGLEENTIVIYMSDNGPNSWRWNGGMKGKKGHLDEGGVRSPFMVQWKTHLPAGRTVKGIASARDILPTLAEAAGYSGAFTNPIDGQSLLPELRGETGRPSDRYIISHWRGHTSIRSQEFRLSSNDELFNMTADPSQTKEVSSAYKEVWEALKQVKTQWEREVMVELPEEDTRTFPVGHPDFAFTQLPARDARFSGTIKRSNRWPNCSFLTNWINTQDSISWAVEVLEAGSYEAMIYYTCKEDAVGTKLQLSASGQAVEKEISEPHDPPFNHPELDRFAREESFAKDFKPLKLGVLNLKKGEGKIRLKTPVIKGNHGVDFRLLMLKRKAS